MSTIILEDRGVIPDSVRDYESFREWTRSDEFPRDGRFAYLGGSLWVDLSMEEMFSHNLLRSEYTAVLQTVTREERRGYFFSDRMFLSHPAVILSTEPDGMFVSFESVRSGLVRLVQGATGFIEIEGSPDMVLELVSRSSVQKDTVSLRGLYHRAGIREYWLVDARRRPIDFNILRHTPDEFVAVEAVDGWLRSDVFGRSFRLDVGTDPLGYPQIALIMQ